MKRIINGIVPIIIGAIFLAFLSFEEVQREYRISENLLGSANNIKINEVNNSTLLQKLDKGTSIIFITNDNSKTSTIYKTLNKLVLKYNFMNAYSYNIKDEERILSLENNKVVEEKKGTKFYNQLLSKLGFFTESYTLTNKKGKVIDTGYRRIYTPFVMFLKEGEIIYSFYLSDENLTEEDLSKILTKGFDLIVKKRV